MSIIRSIREFIKACPYLKDGVIRVDFSSDNPIEYTIYGAPKSAVVRRYADGGAVKQYSFDFSSVEYYGTDTIKNIENSEFYENFSEWLDEQSEAQNLPILKDRQKPQKIEALSNGYFFSGDGKKARYQIQCRLVYYEEAI